MTRRAVLTNPNRKEFCRRKKRNSEKKNEKKPGGAVRREPTTPEELIAAPDRHPPLYLQCSLLGIVADARPKTSHDGAVSGPQYVSMGSPRQTRPAGPIPKMGNHDSIPGIHSD